jgi:cardiolipin synthase
MASSTGTTLRFRLPWRRGRAAEQFVAGNRVRLLQDGGSAFPAMLEAINGAREQILLEMYWFDSGRIGRRFAAALHEALARGVEVGIIYDSIGSIGADPEMFDALERAGAGVMEFNPVAPWKRRFRLSRLTRRDHRKILVVDGAIGFTGGINIGDQWLPEEQEGGGWRDDMVLVEGPAVRGFVDCFRSTWRAVGGSPLERSPAPFGAPIALPEAELQEGVRVLGHSRGEISHSYLSRIQHARRRVWIANSYFVPDRKVVRALCRAADRGVDVRILLPDRSDVPMTDWAGRHVWPRLLRHGVSLYAWTGGILHSKTAVIDGRWATIGTFNLDYLSLRMNLEVTAAFLDEGFGATMEAAFERDFERSYLVDPHAFRYRALGERLLEMIAYRLRKFL